MKRKWSKIWKMPSSELRELVRKSNTFSDVIKCFDGLSIYGGNNRTLKSRLDYEKIDYSHIKLGSHANVGRKLPKAPLAKILVVNGPRMSAHFKCRLLKEGILLNKCDICGCEPIWQNKPLTLVLDHINGKSRDNRLSNLRLLCPNCNSQTPTFTGRNLPSKNAHMCSCGNKITTKFHNTCLNCRARMAASIKNSKVSLSKEIQNGY